MSNSEKHVQITAPMHVSAAGFAAGVATALKAVRKLGDDATIADIEHEIELLLSRANNNLRFNNSIVAHREGFNPNTCYMRTKVDKKKQMLVLTIREHAGDDAGDDADADDGE